MVRVVSYVIWWNKGYQEFDKVVSATTTKVKGIGVTNCSELNITVPGGVNGIRIWDVADYVVPPQVTAAFTADIKLVHTISSASEFTTLRRYTNTFIIIIIIILL